MAMTDVAMFGYPGLFPRGASRNFAFTTITLDAAGEKSATVFQVPKTGNISHVHFRSNTVSSAGNADIRLETVDTSTGEPTGTLVGVNTNATLAVNTATNWYRVALTAPAAVTKGALVALVIENATGNYQTTLTDSVVLDNNFPYSTSFLSGAWTKHQSPLVMLVEYDDATYPAIPGILPIKTLTSVNVNTGSTPDEVGLKFTAPGAIRAAGVWAYFDCDNDCEIHLYDSGSSSIASVTTAMDPQVRFSTNQGSHFYLFPTPVTLTAGATYRLAFKPTSGSNVVVPVFDIDQAAYMAAFPGGMDMVYTSRTDAGAWSETTTRRPQIGLLVDGIDFGGGGVIGPGGLRGGFQ